MPIIVVSEQSTLSTGEYSAVVVDLTLDQGNYGVMYKWKCEITGHDQYSGKVLTAISSGSPSPKGKWVRWAGACLGRPLEPGEGINTDTLVGRPVRLVVTVKRLDDGSEVNRVEEMLPLQRKPKQTALPSSSVLEIPDPFADED